jgi:hypothetical protein
MLLLSKLKARRVPAGFRVAGALIQVVARAKRSASDLPHGMDGNLRTLSTWQGHHKHRYTVDTLDDAQLYHARPVVVNRQSA